jgi:GntR family transcriptional regulator
MSTPKKAKATDIAQELERRIRSGDYAPGERLPTVAAIAEEFATAHNTAHAAIRTLARKGMVTSVRSYGTVVQDWRRPRQIRRARAVHKDEHGFYFDQVAKTWVRATPKSRVTWEPVSDEIADLLGIEYDAEVLIREMVTGEQVQVSPGRTQVNPKQICSTTVPADIAREHDLGRENTGTGGVLFRLEEAYDRLSFSDTTFTRLTTKREAELLQLGGEDIWLLVSVTKVTANVGGQSRVVAVNNVRMDGRAWAIEHNLRTTASASAK